MAKDRRGGAEAAEFQTGGAAWRKRVAVLVALALSAGGLLIMERGSQASAAPAAHVVRTAHAAAASQVSSQVSALTRGAGSLQTVSEMLKSNRAAFDTATAAKAATVASSAATAATASRSLASVVQSARATPAAASAAASALQSALQSTRTSAASLGARQAVVIGIEFCNVTFTVFGGLVIDIPGILHLVIPPIVITISVPCFLSGIFRR
jgi:flagellin-like hook-associated protein FlgL